MSEMNVKGVWKGIKTSPPISKDPVIGMIYQSKKIVGVLLAVDKTSDVAVLLDKHNNQHNVSYNSLKIIISNE